MKKKKTLYFKKQQKKKKEITISSSPSLASCLGKTWLQFVMEISGIGLFFLYYFPWFFTEETGKGWRRKKARTGANFSTLREKGCCWMHRMKINNCMSVCDCDVNIYYYGSYLAGKDNLILFLTHFLIQSTIIFYACEGWIRKCIRKRIRWSFPLFHTPYLIIHPLLLVVNSITKIPDRDLAPYGCSTVGHSSITTTSRRLATGSEVI